MPLTLTRSILTVLLPGLIAVSPWLLWLVKYTGATLGFDSNVTLAHALIFAMAAVVGSLCEMAGTWMECVWDKRREERFQIEENWYVYLSRQFEREPVGYRYISRLVTAMYFELSMLFAVPIFSIGGTLLSVLRFPEYRCPLIFLGAGTVIFSAIFFYWQASSTHKVLCKARAEINKRTVK